MGSRRRRLLLGAGGRAMQEAGWGGGGLREGGPAFSAVCRPRRVCRSGGRPGAPGGQVGAHHCPMSVRVPSAGCPPIPSQGVGSRPLCKEEEDPVIYGVSLTDSGSPSSPPLHLPSVHRVQQLPGDTLGCGGGGSACGGVRVREKKRRQLGDGSRGGNVRSAWQRQRPTETDRDGGEGRERRGRGGRGRGGHEEGRAGGAPTSRPRERHTDRVCRV